MALGKDGSILVVCVLLFSSGKWYGLAENATTSTQAASPTVTATIPTVLDEINGTTTTTSQPSSASAQASPTTSQEDSGTTKSGPSTSSEVTDVEPVTSASSTSPTSTSSSKQPASTTTFDVGSFFGGFVLCAAIVVIIYLGCKVFRTKKPDYNTL